MTIIGNFGVTTQNIVPAFQQTGTWYDLLDNNSTINVTNANSTISLQPGEYKIYGSSPSTLGTEDNAISSFAVYPNPSNDYVQTNANVTEMTFYTMLGKKVLTYKGNFAPNHQFHIGSLPKGIYIEKERNP